MKASFSAIMLTASIMACMSLTNSCIRYRDIAYLQDMRVDTLYRYESDFKPKIAFGDELRITVNCDQMEVAAPFNTNSISSSRYIVNADGLPKTEMSNEEHNIYRVSSEGDIIFPVLGRLHVVTMTLDSLNMTIERMIKDGNYIKDPSVSSEFYNFRVYTMGEFNTRGPVEVRTGNLNILELISTSGDLTTHADRERIAVIRTEGNVRKKYEINLKDTSLYDSPAFNLRQNDIVYAYPGKYKGPAETVAIWSSPVGILSSLMWGVSAIWTLLKY